MTDADGNLLAAIMALQADLINSEQFVESCTHWTTRKDALVIDLMVERGWITPADKIHLLELVGQRLQQNAQAQPSQEHSDTDQVSHSDESDAAALVATISDTNHRYQRERMHARGGIGQIWLASDKSLVRSVALKELLPTYEEDEFANSRFLREARVTAQLQHPGIVPIYEVGWHETNRRPFYAMRFVHGPTLNEAVGAYHQTRSTNGSQQVELLDLLNAFTAVCNTIAYAHSRGVLHRDIKGQNVVLGDFGEVIVLDWGLAKVFNDTERKAGTSDGFASDQATSDYLETMHGQTLGTPAYMAPEQATGRIDLIDHRTDVYGLGAMLYEILTGEPPFSGVNTQEVLQKVRHESPIRPQELVPDISPSLASACLRALAKDPNDRFDSAHELGQTVERWQETQRKEAVEALRVSEAIYSSLVETIPMNVWRKNKAGQFTFANSGFCVASGRSREELIGKTDFDLFPQDAAQKYRRDDQWVMSTGRTFDQTEQHVTGDGDTLFVRVIKLPITDVQGQVVGTQGIFWDVSQVKLLEDELQIARSELRAAINRQNNNSQP